MTLLDRLLNRVIRLPHSPPSLWRADHPAYERILEATAVADRAFHLGHADGRIVCEPVVPLGRGSELGQAIDRALEFHEKDYD